MKDEVDEERQPPADAEYRAAGGRVRPIPGTYFEILDSIRERPGLYLGQKSVELLQVWLWGFTMGRAQAHLPPLPDLEEWRGFDDFVCGKYRWHDVGGWAAKIAYYYRDDATAMDKFF